MARMMHRTSLVRWCVFLLFLLHTVLAEEATDKTLSTDEANAQEVQNFKIKYNNFTILTFVLIALSLIAASASGIGGGGILVGL
jgi:uncharacterized Tic20 family protein